MKALTPAQAELLAYIKRHQATEGVTPSFDEMRMELGLASKSGVHRMVDALEERGFIRRMPNRARCIEVLGEPHLPDAIDLSKVPTRILEDELFSRWERRAA